MLVTFIPITGELKLGSRIRLHQQKWSRQQKDDFDLEVIVGNFDKVGTVTNDWNLRQ